MTSAFFGELDTAHSPERGSGTVLALLLLATIVFAALLLGALGAAHLTRGQAQAAADLAALAGATALRTGFDPCGTAAEAASRNGGAVQQCEVLGQGQVSVEAAVRMPWPGGHRATATAVAGPRPIE